MVIQFNQAPIKQTAKCVFCGHEGNYPHEVMDVDYLDRTGHDTVVDTVGRIPHLLTG